MRAGSAWNSAGMDRLDVRFWHFADIPPAPTNVRYRGYSGHDANWPLCRLMTQSGRYIGMPKADTADISSSRGYFSGKP